MRCISATVSKHLFDTKGLEGLAGGRGGGVVRSWLEFGQFETEQ